MVSLKIIRKYFKMPVSIRVSKKIADVDFIISSWKLCALQISKNVGKIPNPLAS